jgi:hypothetical protein
MLFNEYTLPSSSISSPSTEKSEMLVNFSVGKKISVKFRTPSSIKISSDEASRKIFRPKSAFPSFRGAVCTSL